MNRPTILTPTTVAEHAACGIELIEEAGAVTGYVKATRSYRTYITLYRWSESYGWLKVE